MSEVKKLTLEATPDNLDQVLEFVDGQLEGYDCNMVTQLAIDVAVEELFINIANYAYDPESGPATVMVETLPDPITIIITFMDNGVPYDPLAKADPDMDADIEDRPVGGLGIFMVKNSMDDVTYEYHDGQNILTIKKMLEDPYDHE